MKRSRDEMRIMSAGTQIGGLCAKVTEICHALLAEHIGGSSREAGVSLYHQA
jgi:hypothetical protein